MNQAQTAGLHHLGLTVADLSSTVAFFTHTLGFAVVGGKDAYPAVFVSDGQVLLTLWQAQKSPPTAFDRRCNLGLHHFALRVAEGRSLQSVFDLVREQPNVEIEFSPEPLGAGSVEHFMCRIPGGLRMEIISAP